MNSIKTDKYIKILSIFFFSAVLIASLVLIGNPAEREKIKKDIKKFKAVNNLILSYQEYYNVIEEIPSKIMTSNELRDSCKSKSMFCKNYFYIYTRKENFKNIIYKKQNHNTAEICAEFETDSTKKLKTDIRWEYRMDLTKFPFKTYKIGKNCWTYKFKKLNGKLKNGT